MANKFLDENGLLYLWQKIVAKFATKEEVANAGGGDMSKSTYDSNGNGKVDDAERLGGQLPEYYAQKSELFSGSYKDLSDKPTDFAPTEHTHSMDDIDGLNEAAEELTVALENAVTDMTEIANGKCTSYVFETEDALNTAITEYKAFMTDGTAMSETNVLNGVTLKIGDVFLIKEVKVPDYWWSGTDKAVLETTKVDISTITNAEIDTIVAS